MEYQNDTQKKQKLETGKGFDRDDHLSSQVPVYNNHILGKSCISDLSLGYGEYMTTTYVRPL